jgi:hypothetical protein
MNAPKDIRFAIYLALIFISVGASAGGNASAKISDTSAGCEAYLADGFSPFHANLYRRLGLTNTATAEEIKAAYKKAAKRFHPDTNRTSEENVDFDAAFKKVGEAYSVLSDSDKRRTYDSGTFTAAHPTGSEAEMVLRNPEIYYKSLLKVLDTVDAKSNASVLYEVAKLATKGSDFWEKLQASIKESESKSWTNHDDYGWALHFGGKDASDICGNAQTKILQILASRTTLTPEAIQVLSNVDQPSYRLYALWVQLHARFPEFLTPLTKHIGDVRAAGDPSYVINEIQKLYGRPSSDASHGSRAVGMPQPLLQGLRNGTMTSDYVLKLLMQRWPETLKSLFPNVPFTSEEILATKSLKALSKEDSQVALRTFALLGIKNAALAAKFADLIRFANLNSEYVDQLQPRSISDSWDNLLTFTKSITELNLNSADLNRELLDLINHDYLSDLKQSETKSKDRASTNLASVREVLSRYYRNRAANGSLSEQEIEAVSAHLEKNEAQDHDDYYSEYRAAQFPTALLGLSRSQRLAILGDHTGSFSEIVRKQILASFDLALRQGHGDKSGIKAFLKFFYEVDLQSFLPNEADRVALHTKLKNYFSDSTNSLMVSELERSFDIKFVTLLNDLKAQQASPASFNIVGRIRVLRIFNAIDAEKRDDESLRARFSYDRPYLFGTPEYDKAKRNYDYRASSRRDRVQSILLKLSKMGSFGWMRNLSTQQLQRLLDLKTEADVKGVFALPNADDVISMLLKKRQSHSLLSSR